MLPRRATGLLLAAPLVLAGCGNAERLVPNSEVATAAALDKPAATINPAPTVPPSPAATTAAATTPAATGSATAGTGAPPAAGGTEVKMTTTPAVFAPATLQIKAGDEVTWVSDGFHTVTGGDGTPDPNSPIGDNTLAAAGQSVKKKFDTAGTYKYYCTPHLTLGMKGEIVVK